MSQLSDERDPADPGMALDLAAAELRADHADLASLIETLAVRLEQSLPHQTAVRRRRVGGFRSKRREVTSISLSLGDERFELDYRDGVPVATRHHVVRAITLGRDELTIRAWIAAVVATVSNHAQVTEEHRLALEALLL